MVTFTYIIAFIFAVLNIILFFKIWGMTDDVKSILKEIRHDNNTSLNAITNEVAEQHEIPVESQTKNIQQEDPQREQNDAKQIKIMIYVIAVVVVILIMMLIFANQ